MPAGVSVCGWVSLTGRAGPLCQNIVDVAVPGVRVRQQVAGCGRRRGRHPGQDRGGVVVGWWTVHREKGIADRAFFERECPQTLTGDGEIVVCASVSRTVFYAAVRDRSDGRVWAFVALMRWRRSGLNFAYKDMTEFCGPTADTCPAKVLDVLSPTTHELAFDWRQRCRDHHARTAAGRMVAAAVRGGDVVEFDEAIEFSDGYVATQLTFVSGNLFAASDAPGRRYRVPRWHARSVRVVS
jgi:hypothetical protein